MINFSPELADYERWLVLNKIDLLPEDERESRCDEIISKLNWQGPVFKISAMNKLGTKELVYKIMDYIEEKRKTLKESTEQTENEKE